MKSVKKLLAGAAVAAVMALGATAANATTWLVSGTFDDGATFSGSFDLNVYGFLKSSDITTNVGDLPGYTYTDGDSYVSNGTNYVDYQPGYSQDLHLQFLNPLFAFNAPGAPVTPLNSSDDPIVGGEGGPSYECIASYSCYVPDISNGGDIRYVATGFASAVPEPATWALLLLGFAGIGYSVRRARKESGTLAAV